ncbi:MAG TPA: histidine kinase N-terminal 7TM domain-containing protein [Anaerolineales bacterium]|nr:histidine kinase N-terminal 7TM domain-containing protein [Anaerolineales bacterium]
MQPTPLLYPWLLSVTLTFLTGLYAFRYRRHVAAIPFILMCFFASFWALCYIFELGATSLELKTWGVKLGYIGILGLPLSWTAFALAYSGHTSWITKRNIMLALIFPIITLIVIFTNQYHHWFFTDFGLQTDSASGLILIYNPLGWWFWLHAVYTYGILIFGSYFLVREYWEKREVYRSQIIINMTAILLPWISNGIVLAGLLPVRIDITSVMFSISILIFGWGFLRYQLLDILPVAHRAVFESISDSVIVLDPELRIIELNPAAVEMFKLNIGEVLGKSFQSVFRPWVQLNDKALQTHGYHREIVLENDGEPVRWLHLYVSALRNGASTTEGHIITLRDVTSIKENESALAIARDEAMQANSFKSQLLANVSHELRTPLGIILGYTDLIVRRSYGDLTEKQVNILGRIKDSTQYLDGLVSELLDQAQLDSGKLQLSTRPFEPREVLGSVCNQLSILAEAKNLEFHYVISENMPISIVGDSQRLKQILVNLISNAIKFTEVGRITVNIAVLPSNTEWIMQVIDTGPGIPEESLGTVFEPFKQLANAHKSLRKGYGLGLSIARQLIRLMGGNISLESALGKGTTFTITLPLVVETEDNDE